MIKKLEDLIKFFPLILILLTTLGYIHLQCFYYFFDIEILNYLDVSEIVLLFFDKSILLISGFLIVIAVSYILDDKLAKEIHSNNNPKDSKISRGDKFIKKCMYSVLLFMSLKIIFNIFTQNYIKLIFPIGFGICLLIFFLFEKYLFDIFIEKFSAFFFLNFTISLVALLLINLITISSVAEKGYNLKHNHQIIKQVSFSYNNKTIKTCNKLFYIGETKKNLFLFDSQKNETIIFKMEKIDNFMIKNQ